MIWPLMPCTMKPVTPVKVVDASSTAALSSTPPSSIHFVRPKTAKAMAAAWMTTSTASRQASTR
jgi:hypothetical protein